MGPLCNLLVTHALPEINEITFGWGLISQYNMV